jgi:hypothetical protein
LARVFNGFCQNALEGGTPSGVASLNFFDIPVKMDSG